LIKPWASWWTILKNCPFWLDVQFNIWSKWSFQWKNQSKEPRVFHASCFQNEHLFNQCEHFNQVEPFEKSWFLIVFLMILGFICFLMFPLVVLLPSFLSYVQEVEATIVIITFFFNIVLFFKWINPLHHCCTLLLSQP
jgi:hypothetical protein